MWLFWSWWLGLQCLFHVICYKWMNMLHSIKIIYWQIYILFANALPTSCYNLQSFAPFATHHICLPHICQSYHVCLYIKRSRSKMWSMSSGHVMMSLMTSQLVASQVAYWFTLDRVVYSANGLKLEASLGIEDRYLLERVMLRQVALCLHHSNEHIYLHVSSII